MAVALLSLLTLAATPAAATAIHRCGPDGRSFSQFPCPDAGGQGVTVPTQDDVDADRVEEARGVAARESATAQELARQRLAAEGQAVRGPSVIPFDRSAFSNTAPEPARRKAFRARMPNEGNASQGRRHAPPRLNAR